MQGSESMRKKWIGGNWKMNGNRSSIQSLINDLTKGVTQNNDVDVVVFPPSIYVDKVSESINETAIKLGAQNASEYEKGAYTGEISVAMLKDCAVTYVLVGHSERRHIFHETDEIIREKFHQIKQHDMIPVLCVGETLCDYEAGNTNAVLKAQLEPILSEDASLLNGIVIAYEPVWAIGTGKTATPEYAEAVHSYIRSLVAAQNSHIASGLTIVYGGSVNATNAASLFSMPNIDGGLVGGASLDANQFLEIIKCIN